MLPVVQPGTFDLTLVERKPQRFDEMKRRTGREARAAGVAGVPVDFGMDEDDVDQPELRLAIVAPGGFIPAGCICLTARS